MIKQNRISNDNDNNSHHNNSNNNSNNSLNNNNHNNEDNNNLINGKELTKNFIGPQNGQLGFVQNFSLFSIIGLNSINNAHEDRNSIKHRNNEKSSTNDINNLAKNDNDILNSSFIFLEETLSEISLQYAVCVSEIGEKTSAVQYVRAAIESNNDVPSSSQLFHLLSLLTSSSGDDAKVRTMFPLLFLTELYSTEKKSFYSF